MAGPVILGRKQPFGMSQMLALDAHAAMRRALRRALRRRDSL